jgi:hypothetical protein
MLTVLTMLTQQSAVISEIEDAIADRTDRSIWIIEISGYVHRR